MAVALDASERSLRVIGLAAGIAALLEAELEGVFIEDAALLAAVGLPFQREFLFGSRGEPAACPARLERELRVEARRIEAALRALAAERGCRASFRVWRGDPQAEILAAARGAELFAVSRIGRLGPLWPRDARGARAAGARGYDPRGSIPAPTWPGGTARPAAAPPLSVRLLFDGSEGAARSLDAGAELAARGRASLCIVIPGRDPETVDRRRARALALLRDTHAQARFVGIPDGDPQALLQGLLAADGDIFIVDAGSALLQRDGLRRVLDALDCPVIVVR
jgi:hypothetical protein